MAEGFGYRFLSDAVGTLLCLAHAVKDYYRQRLKTGVPPISHEDAVKIRKDVENITSLEGMYKIEAETTERELT